MKVHFFVKPLAAAQTEVAERPHPTKIWVAGGQKAMDTLFMQ